MGEDKKVREFSPNLALLKAVRHSKTASLSDLCAIAGLDPSTDFRQLSISDLDFRGSDMEAFIISSDLPEHVSALQMQELAQKLTSPLPEISDNTGFKTFLHSISGAVNATNAAFQRDDHISGLPTGFVDLDRKIGGLSPASLVVLAAAPSIGKTAISTQIAFNIAKASLGDHPRKTGGSVGYFSLQLKAEQLAQRILAIESGVPVVNIQRGDITENEFRNYVEAAKMLENIPLFINDSLAELDALAIRARQLKREAGLDLLVVDMIDDFSDGRASSQRHASEIETVLRALKRIAMEHDLCIFATADLGRVVAKRSDKRPRVSDLAEIAVINQFADTVLFLHREEFYVEQQRPDDYDLEALANWQEHMERVHGYAEILVAKQRNGPTGPIDLSFDARLTQFGNLIRPRHHSNLSF
ncbi:DnaB-like helicase C-terminal domain-containing protein [uncultured Tateyamaria sp.]|uniref:DnaB-like helicase C-terminal domain-containing protein n=1 Tax=uncultured Tateyamaria sp. TaxID=455651 RepID=UPI00262953DA|nr:DnaB-like helicase C-terminal domain-containing protein [uncultured Tateyamaria sp.]